MVFRRCRMDLRWVFWLVMKEWIMMVLDFHGHLQVVVIMLLHQQGQIEQQGSHNPHFIPQAYQMVSMAKFQHL